MKRFNNIFCFLGNYFEAGNIAISCVPDVQYPGSAGGYDLVYD